MVSSFFGLSCLVPSSDVERPSLAASPTRLQANPASVLPSTRDRKSSEYRHCAFRCTVRSQASSSWPWRNRSVVRVDQHTPCRADRPDAFHGDDGNALSTYSLCQAVSFTFLSHGMWYAGHEGRFVVARAAVCNSSPPLAGAILQWDGCSFLQRPCRTQTNTRNRTLQPASSQLQRRRLALLTTHCASRSAYSRRSHVVLKTNPLKSAVSEAELSKFHAYSCQAAHLLVQSWQTDSFSSLPHYRATQGYLPPQP